MNRLLVTMLALFAVVAITPAHARKAHHHRAAAVHTNAGCEYTDSARIICGSGPVTGSRTAAAYASARTEIATDQGTILGRRPEGCPHAYCGCGLRKYLGLADTRLNLARNWAKLFPRVAGPAAGVAAVRSGHVMYIESATGNGQWLVRDYNSGGGLSRLHVRDVRGYVFVDPRGSTNAERNG